MINTTDTKKENRTKKGYLYTVGLVLFLIPLIVLVTFYTQVSKTAIGDTVARVRCDELYYYVEDVKYDMDRALQIFGRRAAVYAIDDIVTNNKTMANYTYTNCTQFEYRQNGSSAAIAELMLCGTLYGESVEYMTNHTIPVWISRINNASAEYHYSIEINLTNLTLAMYDAWNFATILDAHLKVEDDAGLCYYVGNDVSIQSLTNITGLEDPLYPLHTDNRAKKYIKNCTLEIARGGVAGCSKADDDPGQGSGAGNVVFYSDIPNDFCSTNNSVSSLILVMDTAFGSCNTLEPECFNISHLNHFAGVIDYASNSYSSFVEKCNISIPWIRDTGDMDDEGHGGGHARDPNCADGYITDSSCAFIRNIDSCDIHEVRIGFDSDELNTSCYIVSNISRFNSACPQGERYLDGPSFFDRLDGRLNLSEKYSDLSEQLFGNPYIGIETLVGLNKELDLKGIPVHENTSWVDYLYWQKRPGCSVSEMCQTGEYDLSLDCAHAYYYQISTDCGATGGVQASSELPLSLIDAPLNGTNFTSCEPFNITGTASDCDGDVNSVEVKINDVPYNTTWDGSDFNMTFEPTENNIYFIRSVATDNASVTEVDLEDVVVFVLGCGAGDLDPPSTPSIEGPKDDYCEQDRTPLFDWSDASDASGIYRYQIEVDIDDDPPDWANLDINDFSYDSTYTPEDDLTKNNDYAWRVRAQDNSGNWGNWSDVETFYIPNNKC